MAHSVFLIRDPRKSRWSAVNGRQRLCLRNVSLWVGGSWLCRQKNVGRTSKRPLNVYKSAIGLSHSIEPTLWSLSVNEFSIFQFEFKTTGISFCSAYLSLRHSGIPWERKAFSDWFHHLNWQWWHSIWPLGLRFSEALYHMEHRSLGTLWPNLPAECPHIWCRSRHHFWLRSLKCS